MVLSLISFTVLTSYAGIGSRHAKPAFRDGCVTAQVTARDLCTRAYVPSDFSELSLTITAFEELHSKIFAAV